MDLSFGSEAFCLAAEAPVDVVAAGADGFPDGSKDLALGGVSSIDPSLLLHFWWYTLLDAVSVFGSFFED